MAAARTITPVNIRLGVDVTKIKEGMQVTSTELRNLSRLTSQSAEGMTKLGYATDLFNKFVSAGQVSRAEADRILESLAKKYGVVTEAARNAAAQLEQQTQAERRINDIRKNAESIMASLETSQQKYIAKMTDLQTALSSGAINANQYNETMSRLRTQYDMLSPTERKAKAALDDFNASMKLADATISGLATQEEIHNRKAEALFAKYRSGKMTMMEYSEQLTRLDASYGVLSQQMQDNAAQQARLNHLQEQDKREIAAVNATLERGITVKERYARQIQSVVRLFNEEKIGAMEARKAIDQLHKEQADETRKPKGSGILGTMVSPRALATGAAFAGIGLAAAGAREIMSLTMAQEETHAMTKALVGNEAATQQLMASYRQLDRESMLSFAAFGQAGKQMLAVGMSTQEVTPMLEGLGKVSGGNEERFHSLVRAMTQVQTAGKLTASEMLQFTNAGWSPLNQIAKRAGETMAETKKRIEAGAVSVQEVKLALMDATTAGGAFANVNEEMQNTFSGQWAKFQSDLQAGAIEFGTSLIPALKEFMTVFKSGASSLPYILAPVKALLDSIALSIAFVKGGFAGVGKFLDEQREISKDAEFQKEMAKQKNQTQAEYMQSLSSEQKMAAQNKQVMDEQEASRKEIAKLEEQTNETIEKKWYKVKFGDEAEIVRLKDKISLAGQVSKLSQEDQDYVNQKRLAEIKMMEAAKEQNDKQEKLLESMRNEVAATEELIRLRKGGLVVSEEDLKKHEKMKEFGNSAAKAEYERMYNRKIALDTEEKRMKEIQADAKKNQEKFQRPEASFQDSVAKLMSQRKLAGLTQDAFEGAGMDLAKSFLQAMNPNNVSTSTAPTMRAGSSEAYKFIQEQNERRAQRAEQKALFERMIRAIESGNDINKNKGVVGTIRN